MYVLVQHIIVNKSINYVNRNNRVKCQHLPGTGTRTRGDWPSGFELLILALKIEHRPPINARMDLFSGWLLLNDHFFFCYILQINTKVGLFTQFFTTLWHFFTLPWATPNSVNFSVFPYHGEIVGLASTWRPIWLLPHSTGVKKRPDSPFQIPCQKQTRLVVQEKPVHNQEPKMTHGLFQVLMITVCGPPYEPADRCGAHGWFKLESPGV